MSDWSEVKTPWFKFTEIGDNIFGTLVSVREIPSQLPGKEGQMTKVYEVKADGGVFHDTDDEGKTIETPIEVKEGEVWNVGGRPGIDNQLRNIKLGSKVKISFEDTKPPKKKGFSPLKIVKVFTNGKMDEEWLKEQEEAGNQDF